MRVPARYFPHRIDIQPISDVGSSTGARFEATNADVRALVVDRVSKVADQRAGSTTTGEEITSSAHIVLQDPEAWVPPGSRVTIWKGKRQQRTGEVIAASYNVHDRAPESAQLWIE